MHKAPKSYPDLCLLFGWKFVFVLIIPETV